MFTSVSSRSWTATTSMDWWCLHVPSPFSPQTELISDFTRDKVNLHSSVRQLIIVDCSLQWTNCQKFSLCLDVSCQSIIIDQNNELKPLRSTHLQSLRLAFVFQVTTSIIALDQAVKTIWTTMPKSDRRSEASFPKSPRTSCEPGSSNISLWAFIE